MVVVGGLTRLTDSGLSITEWRLDKGLMPPLSASRWREEFALYQHTTEFREQNSAMSLAEFQAIYWWEWGHRFLGKMMGLVFAVPFLAFWAMGRLTGRFWPILGLFALGALQGAVGWWMVESGLAGRVDVSPWRLAAHLGMAFAILGLGFWLALDAFGWPKPRRAAPSLPAAVLLALLFVQILLGALLAGADGGKAYFDWPTIGGTWFPPTYGALEPWTRNLAENHAAQQFNHRTLGYLAGLVAAWAGARIARSAQPGARSAGAAVAGLALAQVGLGVAAVMHAAPFSLSLLHQLCAALLWLAAVALARVGVMRNILPSL